MTDKKGEAIGTLIFLLGIALSLMYIAYKIPNPLSPLMSSIGVFILVMILFGVGVFIVVKVLEEYW